ncbi:adenine-specific methyltransferase EcoRI family protein [Mycoplasmoides pneumoniae]|uniref:Type II methyltransferase M.MpnI n=2 Tax=Mycoplasmoides pneumoniae TaxID=2104 RepID=MTM1_MYCPN|nr:adenine-specific methyltransferase EcoRI family protein [Mycoplasmoides pneumoniae]Q50290.1 RecName: Full=Type II methyltransferase M.MpnI; Short=M.MpnI [Mycoplasmoides pneumoniae M129]AAB96281.1 adenine-specific methyltransferase EcoRI [Mycoplasmoides pneumoniae M129]AAC43683.1 adenine specific DNA modification methylase [Mycoplasmoides pneumoniae]AGC04125.1 adenine methylase [Mycoplasmoides pneumoniae M129-B7]ALA30082.1 adenine methylase [Mycoplasmoides pneumoniae PI 1428]ALA32196.1 aden
MHYFNRAKKAKNNEFYTLFEDIAAEVACYPNAFKGKVVLCNCNDGYQSNFWQFFQSQFHALGLKKLVAIAFNPLGNSYQLNFDGKEIKELPLAGNGSFDSAEAIVLLKQSDIVVTNPPFSLFQDFVCLLAEHGKQFLVLGHNGAVGYNQIFKLFKEEQLWYGHTVNSSMLFQVQSNFKLYDPKSVNFVKKDGQLFQKVPGISWFTNLKKNQQPAWLKTKSRYQGNEHKYPKFDWYDAIFVSKVKEIPLDWFGYMGVPLTFLNCFNPKQFELIDCLANPYATLDTLKTNAYVRSHHGDVRNVKGKRRYVRVVIKQRQNVI